MYLALAGGQYAVFQSPLHRGILCNCHAGCRYQSRVQLSVPSSSGNTLQPQPRACRERAARLSVPSSSGNTLQLLARRVDLRRQCAFQSPLHRGILCNAALCASRKWQAALSVPSSSRNTLQLVARSEADGAITPFSPLFIGEYSATAARGGPAELRGSPFSPLFIGEYSATRKGMSSAAPRSNPFSPLFIGEYSATAPRPRRPRWFLPFSPLFIGEYSATEDMAAHAGGAHSAFSP